MLSLFLNHFCQSLFQVCKAWSFGLVLSFNWCLELFSVVEHLLRVVPVIGILNDKEAFKPAPNPAEVESVFDAPLEMFIKDENRRVEEREWMGNKYLIHFFDYETNNKKYMIWGLTAGILIRAASIVYERPPPFVPFIT
ncbi:putative NAD(+) diphosphatase [Rosa chinensis]|uniref:Putative NAD(+) diphosphatase n=1 Tax=Rosa chinensis TaxID=74649 RepID=A0A2P6RX42_ROSCH|nr:putative NAD(+) diphosphatase [Rosa chinensis]